MGGGLELTTLMSSDHVIGTIALNHTCSYDSTQKG